MLKFMHRELICLSSQIDGEKYWYYEYLVRKAPLRLVSNAF